MEVIELPTTPVTPHLLTSRDPTFGRRLAKQRSLPNFHGGLSGRVLSPVSQGWEDDLRRKLDKVVLMRKIIAFQAIATCSTAACFIALFCELQLDLAVRC